MESSVAAIIKAESVDEEVKRKKKLEKLKSEKKDKEIRSFSISSVAQESLYHIWISELYSKLSVIGPGKKIGMFLDTASIKSKTQFFYTLTLLFAPSNFFKIFQNIFVAGSTQNIFLYSNDIICKFL